MAVARQFSGLQLDVLKLYRELMRSAKNKDPTGALGSVVSQKFRENASSVRKTEFKVIEHRLRWGYKQKKMLEMPSVSVASLKKMSGSS